MTNEKNFDKDFLNVKEASTLLGLTEGTLYVKVCKKEITYYKPGKHLLFKKSELLEMIENSKVEKA